MGVATAGVGLTPSAAAIGVAAPVFVILLRILQGLALGGEYGGAAIYVSEHSPPAKAGFYTSFIQASVVGGFVLSLIVVLSCKFVLPEAVWIEWGWRIPFILSLALLVISLWMRMKLSESPVFAAMKEAGETSRNPFVESFTYPGNAKRLFVALFGIAAGFTVIWYTAMFSGLAFLKGPMRVEATSAEIIVGCGAAIGMAAFVFGGWLSDRIGRKKPIVIGYALTLLLLFPSFWLMGNAANPELVQAKERVQIVVSGPNCEFDPFADKQKTDCGKLVADLSSAGLPFSLDQSADLILTIDSQPVDISSYPWDHNASRKNMLFARLAEAGVPLETIIPSFGGITLMIAALLMLSVLSGLTYGPVAALLSEMFPAKIRYSSMSIPYHIGTGYFGGFLPFISSYIVARTGDPYAGLWYTWAVVAVAFVVTMWGLKNSPQASQFNKI